MSFIMGKIKQCSYGLLLERNFKDVSSFYVELDRDKDEKEEMEKFLKEQFFNEENKRGDYVFFPLTFEEFCIFNTSFIEEEKNSSQMPFPCFLGYIFSHRKDILEFCETYQGYPVKRVIGLLNSLEGAYKELDSSAIMETLDALADLGK